jgi:hypothetical protein
MSLAIVSEIGQNIVDRVKDNIRAGVDVYDMAFEPLKDASGNIPLNRTLELLNSIGYRVNSIVGGRFELILYFGTTYGHYHVSGTSKMVARPFMPNSNDIPRAWLEIIQNAINGQPISIVSSETFINKR